MSNLMPNKSLQATWDCISNAVPQYGTDYIIRPAYLSSGR